MSLAKDIIKMDIINNDHLLDRLINDWNLKYNKTLEKLTNKLGVNTIFFSNSDSESEKSYKANDERETAYKLIKQAIKCKAYAETEYKSIKDIRSELEDCQMIKELGLSLRRSEEEKSEQSIKLKTLNGKINDIQMGEKTRERKHTVEDLLRLDEKLNETKNGCILCSGRTFSGRKPETRFHCSTCHHKPDLELIQENQNLEKSLLELSLQTKLAINPESGKPTQYDGNDRKSSLTAKLEAYTNRTQIPKRVNKIPDYCHIAPNVNLFSDSELSISEEDSLEKDRNNISNDCDINDTNSKHLNKDCLLSPDKFCSGIEHASKSTPLKNNLYAQINGTGHSSQHSNAVSNLTQDLKDIQKYFDKKDDDAINAPTHILDWEMSQISFDDVKDHHINGYILEGKEDPDDNHLPMCSEPCWTDKMIKYSAGFNSNAIQTSQNLLVKTNDEMDKLHCDLKNEKDKYNTLSLLISDLYTLVHKSSTETGMIDVPICSGDRPSIDIEQDPVEQMRIITITMDKNSNKDKMDESGDFHDVKQGNENIDHYKLTDVIDKSSHDDFQANIFKTLSETSVRLLTEIVTKMGKTNQLISENRVDLSENDTKDYTLLVTEYLQYLMSLDSVDFENGNCRRHPIYDMVVELELNVLRMVDKQLTSDKGNNTGFSQSLESFYQEQLNKCYDDINRLKQQLESTQQLLINKLPLDATQALFEAKQKLQNELESVDREYARQMARERKRLEESESMYNELLNDHEMMQQKYNENVISLNQQIEQLERKIEADRRFIDQQQFEWELERTQHSVDIDNLNKSLGQIKRSSSCSENLSNCLESQLKEKLQKSNSVPKSKNRSLSLESAEISFNEAASQTIFKDVIILNANLLLTDLDKYDEFQDLREDIKRNQIILLDFIHLFSSMIFELTDNNQLQFSLHNLQEFDSKIGSGLFQIADYQCQDIQTEILNVRDFFKSVVEDKANLKSNLVRVQEELEINLTNSSVKQDMVAALEEEIQSLIEFQRNLSKDYDLLQSMLEEKQNELDKLSARLLSEETIDNYEESIRVLKKESNEKQNIIDERDEDLYVLREEKEIIEKDLILWKEKHETLITQHKDIYQDLEKELKDTQIWNSELQKRINEEAEIFSQKLMDIENLTKSKDLLEKEIFELNQKNDTLVQNTVSLIDENKLNELRLTEIKDQHKLEIGKLNTSLDEMERLMNRKIVEECKANKVMHNTTSCQTESIDNGNVGKESLMNFVNIQDKLIKSIDKLRKKYNQERELRNQIEAKYKHFSSQYQTLSNKVFILGDKVNENNDSREQNGDDNISQSVESIDINELLNESQISIDEDTEFHKVLQECFAIEPINDYSRTIATQTDSTDRIEGLKDNINMFSDVGCFSLSEWFPDLLKEVEIVLQSCVIGDDLPSDMVVKMNRFRNLLEQMYKKQLSILLNKISSTEHEIQLHRKTNQELKHKSDFIMTELQEKDSSMKNLRIRLDQEISNSARLVEVNRNLLEQNRLIKNDLSNQISHFKDELDRERNKYMDINRQLRNEQHSHEQLEAALSVAEERIKLVEQSNVELIKKTRQQADYQQKEMDNFNIEYAEIFRICNNYKIQLEALQQNLQYQNAETEKTKGELHETIQSNTEYRDKMNEFVKIYQERRKKLETEVNELHQLLQISCRREITFVKENETLRVKCQSIKSICKDYEKKLKELENFVSDLHSRHEEDRQEWLNMINGNIDAKGQDDGVLSQINWLLKMLQLRIELLILHYIPTESTATDNRNGWEIDPQRNPITKSRPYSADSGMNRGNSELMMLLQSIKSMQSMINLYLNRNLNQISDGINQSLENKNLYTNRLEKHSVNSNNITNRPKPTGSSDSLDSISDTDSVSDHHDSATFRQEIDNISSKIYIIQTNKIIELQLNLDHCEKWRHQLIEQKKYILSQLSHKLCNVIATPLLTEEQKMIIQQNFLKFKFKAVAIAIIANMRFIRSIQSPNLNVTLGSRLKKAGLQLPQPKFSTNIPINKSSQLHNNLSSNNNVPSKAQLQSNSRSNNVSVTTCSETGSANFRNHKSKVSNPKAYNESIGSHVQYPSHTSQLRCNLSPVASCSPTLDRHNNRPIGNNISSLPRTVNKSICSGNYPVSNSYSNSLRKSFPMSTIRKNVTNSFDRNVVNKSSNYSITLKQIDDFGKRLDKYTDVSNGV